MCVDVKGSMEVSGNHFRRVNCEKIWALREGLGFWSVFGLTWPKILLKRVWCDPYKASMEVSVCALRTMLGQKISKIWALREGLRFLTIFSLNMISRDLHGTLYVDDSDILYFIYVLLSVLELTKAHESVTPRLSAPAASAPRAVVAWFLRW